MANTKQKMGKILTLCLLTQALFLPAALSQASTNNETKEPVSANTVEIPTQILKTGVSLSTHDLSPNSAQLANTVGLTPVLQRLQTLQHSSIEYIETRQTASLLIQKANLEIDFALAEIGAELQIYNEILSTFTSDRDKLLARVNAASFISNGILWAACEGLSIPSYNGNVVVHPKSAVRWSIPSGITGILAGVVPSIASGYTLKAVNGKRKTSEVDPNMLAKLFGYPTTNDIEYPHAVWEYLNQVPANEPRAKKRVGQLVDRWIADANMPGFTDRSSKKQLDVLTASVAQRKGLTIATLSARQAMLQQLASEITKMKRMLLELTMVVLDEKHI